jgi:hypothetical protein
MALGDGRDFWRFRRDAVHVQPAGFTSGSAYWPTISLDARTPFSHNLTMSVIRILPARVKGLNNRNKLVFNELRLF